MIPILHLLPANAAMHLGMSDLTILRYAKKWQYGFSSAVGMFLGHYVACFHSVPLLVLFKQQKIAPNARHCKAIR